MMNKVRTVRHRVGRLKQLCACYIKKWRNKRAVYLIMTPTHGNLGDHAIAQVEIEMLNRLQIPFIDVSTDELRDWEQKGLFHVMNGRPILISGGGNLGTIWFSLEKLIRGVVLSNPKSRIFILPNTMYYHDNEKGRVEMEASEVIYNAHPQLTVYAREVSTYEAAKKLYYHVKLIPDLALSMDYSQNECPRDGCVICLRSDKERTRSSADDIEVLRQIQLLFGDKIVFKDMNVNHSISPESRNEAIREQCDVFKRAQVVITDRLHGMVFCAITGTPCVVINSQSPKIRASFEWVKDLGYIKFCDNLEQLTDNIRSVIGTGGRYDNSTLQPYYRELEKDLLAAFRSKH